MSATNGKGFLNREAIFGTVLKQEIVEIPEWNGKVIVREMTALERDRYEFVVRQGRERNDPDMIQYRARICVACTIDEHGDQVFKPEDIEELSAKSAKAMDRIWEVALRLSGIIAEEKKEPSPPSADSITD